MGANAAKDIITNEDKRKISMVIVAAESAVDAAKSSRCSNSQQLIKYSTFCVALDEEACYAATPAIQWLKI